mgnify:CR=1 FL=1
MNIKPSAEQLRKHPIAYGIIGTLVVFIIYGAAMALFFRHQNPSEPWVSAGTFGDMFGCLSAFFASLAFMAMIYTIYIQTMTLASMDKNERDNKALLEQHWYFSHIDRINTRWLKERNFEKTDINEINAFIRDCIISGANKDAINKLSKMVASARTSLTAYSIIVYTVGKSYFFTPVEKRDNISMTFGMLDDDLQFCIGVLLMKSNLKNANEFCKTFFSTEEICRRYCARKRMEGYEEDMRKLAFKLLKALTAVFDN